MSTYPSPEPAYVPQPSTLRREVRGLVRLSIPVVMIQLGMMAFGVVDVMMVGHLSEDALAAVSLGHTFSFALMVVGMGALHVLDPLVAQAVGARDAHAQGDALQRGMILALLLATPLMAAIFFGRPLLEFLSDQPMVVPGAHGYAAAVAPGIPAFFVFVVMRQSLQAMSIVRPVIVAVVLGNLANVVLNLGFVHGYFGFPAMGAVGSGVASTICRFFMAGLLAYAAKPIFAPLWHPLSRDLISPRRYGPMLAKGLPIGLQMSLEVWVFNAIAILMVRMGTLELAGHAVAMNLVSVTFMVPLGIGAAAATRVGNAVGAGDFQQARLTAVISLCMGGFVMLASAASFILFPRELARLYSSEPEIIAMAALLLPIAGLFQVFDGVQAVGCGILRGAGDTRFPAGIALVGFWMLGLPTGCLLAYYYGLGPRGLWWGLTVGLAAVAIALTGRIAQQLRGDGASHATSSGGSDRAMKVEA